jgi:hypothetical protein
MTRRRKRHRTDDIVAKLRDAGTMLEAGKDLAAVREALEVGDPTPEGWRAQHSGMNCEEAEGRKQLVADVSLYNQIVKHLSEGSF